MTGSLECFRIRRRERRVLHLSLAHIVVLHPRNPSGRSAWIERYGQEDGADWLGEGVADCEYWTMGFFTRCVEL